MTTDITDKLDLDLNVEFLVEFADRHVRMAAYMPHWELLGSRTVQELEHPEFVDWICSGLAQNGRLLNELGDSIRDLDVRTRTNVELSVLFQQVISALEKFLRYNQFVNTSDFYHNKLTNRLIPILESCLADPNAASVNSAYSVLTTPAELVLIQQEEEDALKILEIIKKEDAGPRSRPELERKYLAEFDDHARKYFWISYEQEGHVLTATDFLESAVDMLNYGTDPTHELAQLRQRRERNLQRFAQTWNSVNLPKEHEQIFQAARRLVYWKLHLREIKVRFYCCAENLMGEIAKRLGLDGTQVRHLAETEIVTWLKSSKLPNHSAIDDRIKHSVFRFSSGGVEIRVGDDAKKEFGIVVQDEPIKSLARIGGTCGQPGRAIGRTRQVLTVEDMAVFRRGEILVAYMTDVGVVPAMRRAAAIITDVGGVTCHAAIVAREFGIPCVIGTKVGTKVLKNGYLVDVNTGIFDLLDRG